MQPQVKIISDDLCVRNGLKSKVSTLEELLIFSLKIPKNYIYDVIFGAADILSTDSLTCGIINLYYTWGGLQWGNHLIKS